MKKNYKLPFRLFKLEPIKSAIKETVTKPEPKIGLFGRLIFIRSMKFFFPSRSTNRASLRYCKSPSGLISNVRITESPANELVAFTLIFKLKKK